MECKLSSENTRLEKEVERIKGQLKDELRLRHEIGEEEQKWFNTARVQIVDAVGADEFGDDAGNMPFEPLFQGLLTRYLKMKNAGIDSHLNRHAQPSPAKICCHQYMSIFWHNCPYCGVLLDWTRGDK